MWERRLQLLSVFSLADSICSGHVIIQNWVAARENPFKTQELKGETTSFFSQNTRMSIKPSNEIFSGERRKEKEETTFPYRVRRSLEVCSCWEAINRRDGLSVEYGACPPQQSGLFYHCFASHLSLDCWGGCILGESTELRLRLKKDNAHLAIKDPTDRLDSWYDGAWNKVLLVSLTLAT